jgi:hypothetical protein
VHVVGVSFGIVPGFRSVLEFILGVRGGGVRVGWVEVVVVGSDGGVDGVAPSVGPEGVDVFVLG